MVPRASHATPPFQGHVVTNYHVIKGASEVKVTLLDQSTWVGRACVHDVVVCC
jgi:S1-C subfamily serine protease